MQIDRDKALELWGEGWSLRMIGEYLGCSHAGVKKVLNILGVDTSKAATWREVECIVCSKVVRRTRSHYRRVRHPCCSRECYFAWLEAGALGEGYAGGYLGRLGRWKVEQEYGELPIGSVVHHENGDRTNNQLRNLVLFRNQGDHIRWHRGFRDKVNPLWSGLD